MTFSDVIVLHDEFLVLEHCVMLLNSLRFPGNVGYLATIAVIIDRTRGAS